MNQSTEVKHTPTPWHLRNENTCIAYSDGELVSYLATTQAGTTCPEHGTAEANAAFIVRAVNSHEELLNAAKKYLTYSNSLDHDVQRELINAIAKAEDKPL